MTARTPEQDDVRLPVEAGPVGGAVDNEPIDSRRIRRRLTFGVAADLAGLPASLSPWQRAYEAWRSADLPWGHGPAPRVPSAAPSAAASVAPSETPFEAPAETPPEAPSAWKPIRTPIDQKVYSPPEPRRTPARTRRLRAGVAIAAGLVLVAGGAIVLLGRDGGGTARPRVPAAVSADRLFAADPVATTDGLVQNLAALGSDGATLVAAGTEGPGAEGRERAEFLYSSGLGGSGSAWRTARVRAADGSEPPLGDRPRLVSGGQGTWVALGRDAGGAVVTWTGKDAKSWTRQPPTGAVFRPSDEVNALARTPRGFVAAGAASGRAVVWSSADGRAWQRLDGLRAAGITGLDRLAASGDVLVTHGTYQKKVTRKKGRRKATRTVRGEGVWRSADGGRTWTAVDVPQGHGSHGATKGLVAWRGGFATVREGSRTTGRRKHRRTTRFGVLLTSPDGRRWRAAGTFGGAAYTGVERFGGSAEGLAVLITDRVKGRAGRTVLRSADGRTWQPTGTVAGPAAGPATEVSGLTVAPDGTVALAGHRGDDAYLSGVDLASVPGAVHTERTIRSVSTGPGRVVAVGSTNGATAVWSSPDGRQWTRAPVPSTPGWLSDVAYGSGGWLAVGRASGASSGPLAFVSPDGASWTKVPFPKGASGTGPSAVTTGPAGYVAVGPGAARRTTDRTSWKRTGIDGRPTDVAATARGYVAVGSRGTAPAIWTSPDGLTWKTAELPAALAPGPLTRVAARGDALIAVGPNSAPLVSTDAGATWTPRPLTGTPTPAEPSKPAAPALSGVRLSTFTLSTAAPQLATPPTGTVPTAVAATPKGWVVAGTLGRAAGIWTSRDGAAWRRVPAAGLDGPGDSRLTVLTSLGGDLLALGTRAAHRGTSTLLWRAAMP
ncbi:hypothetical protein [Actinomadura terrae]|uniref:hypothetical protein n=1 Tax=Actinomadura terrae TaxID=604353 RepID=UPI001FA6ECF7|nr:hypothetical protein [Actinomadura terrae]